MDKYRRIEPLSVDAVVLHALRGGHFFQQCGGPNKWKFYHNSWIMNSSIQTIRMMVRFKRVMLAAENPRDIPDSDGGF